ncbi:hypothetical protein GCM10018955_05160 [Planomonospora venezuelensis]|uniref:DnaJ-class molecular chaperone n=1 Tax=Planomonospora venezuelensis TaxID=1999 RepID=A0A841D6D2_PLAVE|nr:DnaJ-class molecular chaperone [Planomonospora venezuelensis]
MELILIVGVALGFWWVWDRRRHPVRSCRRCGGSGKRRSAWNGAAYGACSRCGGKGETKR